MKIRNKLITSFFLGIALFLAVFVLNGNTMEVHASNVQDDPLVGICLPVQNEYYTELARELINEYAAQGFYNVVVFYANNSIQTQIEQIENLIDQGVSVLVIAPIDADLLDNVLNQAASQGIHIIQIGMASSGHPSSTVNVYWDFFERGVNNAQQFLDDRDLDNRDPSDPAYLNIYLPYSNDSYIYLDGLMSVLQEYIDSGVLIVNIYWIQDPEEVYNMISNSLGLGGNTVDSMSIVKDFAHAVRRAYEDAGCLFGPGGARFYGENISYSGQSMAEKIAELTKKILDGEDVETGEKVYYIEITDEYESDK